jgi:long-chain fatty acid transport protein
VTNNLKFGFGLTVPFGLTTDYNNGWRGQLTALKSEIKTINLNGALSYKLSNALSVGVGVSWQKIDAELTNFAGAAGNAKVEADDNNWGANIGVMFSPSPSTRIGAHYRSSINYQLSGSASFSAAPAANGPVTANLRVPESFSLSFFTAINPRWDMMGDVTWTRWSRLERLTIVRTTGAVLSILPLAWDDTTRISLGLNYKPNATWKFRFGIAHDPTPTNDVDRTPRLPDQDRTWVAVGAQYRLSKASTLDFGYAHEFIRDASVNVPAPAPAPGFLNGKFENKADIFSVQFNYAF